VTWQALFARPYEEVTITYVPLTESLAERRRELLSQYKFTCVCERCRREEGEEVWLGRYTHHAVRLNANPHFLNYMASHDVASNIRYCPPRRPPTVRPSPLDLHGILRRGEQNTPGP